MSLRSTLDRLWPDHSLLSLALGAYAGLLVVLWVVATTDQSATAEATLAPAWLAVGAVALLTAAIPDFDVVLARTRLHYALYVVPAGVLVVSFRAGFVAVGPEIPVDESTVLVGLLSGLPAMAAVRLAEGALADRIRAANDPGVAWTARQPRSAIRRKRFASVAGGVVLVAGIVVGFVSTDVMPILLGVTIGSVLGNHYGSRSDPREFVAYPDALVIDRAASPTVVPWTRVSGYSLTDDALVLHRRFGWSLRCSRGDIDDLDGVIRYLDRHQSGRENLP